MTDASLPNDDLPRALRAREGYLNSPSPTIPGCSGPGLAGFLSALYPQDMSV